MKFFKANWHIVGDEVCKAVKQFSHTGKLLKQVNCTTITLVPKKPKPSYVKDFRPIACCTTLYKIIARILTDRMKKAVDLLVGPAQSAFIEGRIILDNVILSHELVKSYTRKSISLRCTIKIDVKKAYDSIEWSFLRSLLLELGIPYRFVMWVMECVCSVSYVVLFNGGLTPYFKAEKGLRQGDPMSPYLFVIAVEYLNRCLN